MKFKRPGPTWLLPPYPGLLQRGKVPTHIKAYIILCVRSTGAGIPCELFEKDTPRNYPHTSTYIYIYIKYLLIYTRPGHYARQITTRCIPRAITVTPVVVHNNNNNMYAAPSVTLHWYMHSQYIHIYTNIYYICIYYYVLVEY